MQNVSTFLRLFSLAIVLAIAGCSSGAPSEDTPTNALKRYVTAQQKGDVATMKRLLSNSSIAFIETIARSRGKTVEDVLLEETKVRIATLPETRNEKIEGDTATVEVRDDQSGEFDLVYPFVREDGEWKLARDKQIESILKKANEERERIVRGVGDESRTNSNTNK